MRVGKRVNILNDGFGALNLYLTKQRNRSDGAEELVLGIESIGKSVVGLTVALTFQIVFLRALLHRIPHTDGKATTEGRYLMQPYF